MHSDYKYYLYKTKSTGYRKKIYFNFYSWLSINIIIVSGQDKSISSHCISNGFPMACNNSVSTLQIYDQRKPDTTGLLWSSMRCSERFGRSCAQHVIGRWYFKEAWQQRGFQQRLPGWFINPIYWVRLDLPTPGQRVDNLGTTCECFKCNMLLAAEWHLIPCREIWGGLAKFLIEQPVFWSCSPRYL